MKKLLPLVLALALLPLACSSGDGDGGDAAETGAAAEVAEDAASGGAGEAPPEGAISASLPAIGERIVKTATIRMSVREDGLEAAVDRVRGVATGLAGFVVSSSSRRARADRPEQATLVLRVPSRSYERALAALTDAGRIEAQRESSEEVSEEFVDLESRSRHLRAVEVQMLELLNRARTVAAALAVQDRLNAIQLELEQVRGRLRFLENQTSFATISLSIGERGAAAPTGDGGWGIVEAWRDGAKAFVQVAGRAFVVLAGALPLVLLALLGWLGVRTARRRSLLRWGASRT
jgi:uncharacterized protein YjhX (UPF0386 family)